MQRSSDFIVVGGGIIGLLLCRELLREGVSVTLIEANSTAGESSWAGGGILSSLYPWRTLAEINSLILFSQQYYPKLAVELLDETRIDIELINSGLLVLDNNDNEKAVAWANEYGAMIEEFDAKTVIKSEPNVHSGFRQALSLPAIQQVRNPRLVQALKQSLLGQSKLTIMEHSPVQQLLVSNHTIQGVDIGHYKVMGSSVVLATGAWTDSLLKPFDITLSIEPVRGQMIAFKTPSGFCQHIILRDDHYLIPRCDGTLLVGSSIEYVGFDKSTTHSVFTELKQKAVEILPALANYPVIHHWAGLRPGSSTGIPIISQIQSIAGLSVNAGHFRNGLVLGPASAHLLVDLLLNREPIVDPTPYLCNS